jgi:hypothetical protein
MRSVIFILCLTAGLQAQDPQRIRLNVDRQDGANWKEVDPALVFNADDRLRFRVSANFSGYLYVMNHGTSGEYELLFPRSDTGADNRMEDSKEYVVPASQGWFNVSGPAGQDVIYWLVSPVALANAYKPLPPRLPNQAGSPAVPESMHPRCDDSILKARGECIDDSAGVKPVKPGEALPSNLAGIAGATPRELLFMQEQGGTVLSSPTPLAGPVVYELRLSHN